MNKTIIVLIALALLFSLQAQDITNTLGGNTSTEVFDVEDSSNNTLLRVQGDGSVGIGTNSPTEVLDVDGNIAVYGTVDGIDISTDVTANNAKVTNATHTGDVTGSTALTIGANKVTESHLKAVDPPSDEQYLTYEATVGDFEWQDLPIASILSKIKLAVWEEDTNTTVTTARFYYVKYLADITFPSGRNVIGFVNAYWDNPYASSTPVAFATEPTVCHGPIDKGIDARITITYLYYED